MPACRQVVRPRPCFTKCLLLSILIVPGMKLDPNAQEESHQIWIKNVHNQRSSSEGVVKNPRPRIEVSSCIHHRLGNFWPGPIPHGKGNAPRRSIKENKDNPAEVFRVGGLPFVGGISGTTLEVSYPSQSLVYQRTEVCTPRCPSTILV